MIAFHKHPVGLLFFILLTSIITASCSEFSRIQKKGDVTAKLEAGIRYYNKKDYYKSSVLLEEIVPLLKGTAQAEQALYYLAYDYFMQEQYPMSSFYFKEFYQTYNRSQWHEETMFMYGKSLYKDSPVYNLDQTNTYESMRALQAFMNRYPNSTYIPEGNKIMDELSSKLERREYENARLYFKVHNYKSAVVALTNFIDQYPNSNYTEELTYVRLESQYKLAKNSVPGPVQLERYYDAIGFYRNFVEKYPGSKYLNDAKKVGEMSQSDLSKIKAKTI